MVTTTKLTSKLKLIGKTITVRHLSTGEVLTGIYQGRVAGRRPCWVRLSGMQLQAKDWEVVRVHEGKDEGFGPGVPDMEQRITRTF